MLVRNEYRFKQAKEMGVTTSRVSTRLILGFAEKSRMRQKKIGKVDKFV